MAIFSFKIKCLICITEIAFLVLLELVTGLEPLVPNGDELRNWSKEYIEERKVQVTNLFLKSILIL